MNGSDKFMYDNLPGYEYVNISYDTYQYRRKTPKGAAIKTKVGTKICRFAQFPNGKYAIMPTILKDLLAARKATRTEANFKTIKTNEGDYTGLVLKTDDNTIITLQDKKGALKIIDKGCSY